jgi:probable addiction module antidote protein
LLALRSIAEAFGGLAAVAASAGISRESLYRALSPKGNPTLKTLLAVVNAVGLRLTVVEMAKAGSRRKKTSEQSKAA